MLFVKSNLFSDSLSYFVQEHRFYLHILFTSLILLLATQYLLLSSVSITLNYKARFKSISIQCRGAIMRDPPQLKEKYLHPQRHKDNFILQLSIPEKRGNQLLKPPSLFVVA